MPSLAPPALGPRPEKSALERALGLFTDLQPGEGVTAVLLTIDVFLLLTAYYLLKTVREPLVLTGGGAEVKSYASAGQAVLLIGVVRGYAALSRRYGRMTLVAVTTLFFASNLVLFWALGRLGVPFYLWVGCFNLTVLAQFWSFANDVYTPEQGKRLFAIVGLGSSLGAMFGAVVARALIVPLGPYWMMLVAAAVLLVCLGIVRVVHGREARRPAGAATAAAPPGGTDGFRLLLGDRYLLLIAALALVLNWVNASGEYLLDRTLLDDARRQVATGTSGGLGVGQIVGVFKAGYFLWTNAVGAAVQLFLVSRIFKYLGPRAALLILPIITFGGYLAVAAVPVLGVVKALKISENSLDYSLQNTARQALFLPVSREAKYNAKAAVDTVLVRVGDVLSACVVWLGVRYGFGVAHFAYLNLALVAVWLGLVWALGKRFVERTRAAEEVAHAGAVALAAAG